MEKFEYLDHTADIQVHAWGNGLEEAFVNAGHAMFGYMFNRENVEVKEQREITVEGCSLNMLLYNYLEELLYTFSCDPYLAIRSISIKSLCCLSTSNAIATTENRTSGSETVFKLVAVCEGEEYERGKHGSRTEIKAVTFSNMQIIKDEQSDKVDIYVIFDI